MRLRKLLLLVVISRAASKPIGTHDLAESKRGTSLTEPERKPERREPNVIGLDDKTNDLIGPHDKINDLIGLDDKTNDLIGLDDKINDLIGLDDNASDVIGLKNKTNDVIGLDNKVDEVGTDAQTTAEGVMAGWVASQVAPPTGGPDSGFAAPYITMIAHVIAGLHKLFAKMAFSFNSLRNKKLESIIFEGLIDIQDSLRFECGEPLRVDSRSPSIRNTNEKVAYKKERPRCQSHLPKYCVPEYKDKCHYYDFYDPIMISHVHNALLVYTGILQHGPHLETPQFISQKNKMDWVVMKGITSIRQQLRMVGCD